MRGDSKLKEFEDFISKFKNNLSTDINVSLLARVENINQDKLIADIKPLKRDLPLIQQVPISTFKVGDYFIKSNIKKGDIVVVTFSDYSLDGYIDDGKERDAVLSGRHSLDNAVIVGVIAPLNTPTNQIRELKDIL